MHTDYRELSWRGGVFMNGAALDWFSSSRGNYAEIKLKGFSIPSARKFLLFYFYFHDSPMSLVACHKNYSSLFSAGVALSRSLSAFFTSLRVETRIYGDSCATFNYCFAIAGSLRFLIPFGREDEMKRKP